VNPAMRRIDCLLIADDLTGACDAAVQFARRGRHTVVALGGHRWGDAAQVLAISTDSRDAEPEAIPGLMREAAASLPVCETRVIFKKIDSTLRGHAGCEIAAALDAFECDAAVIAPAFPAMGRIVKNGFLAVTSDAAFEPIHLPGWLEQQGAQPCTHLTAGNLATALTRGARFLSLDTVCDEDLAGIVAAGLASGRRILWAGSAGLASALAASLNTVPHTVGETAKTTAGVLYCIGSDHPVTLEQQRRLLASRASVLLQCEHGTAECVTSALDRGEHVVLRIPRGRVAPERVRNLLAGAQPAALVLSGGDTASLVCDALGVAAIELGQEVAAGIPAGILRGGMLEGRPVVTKSGGFGVPEALIKVADNYHA